MSGALIARNVAFAIMASGLLGTLGPIAATPALPAVLEVPLAIRNLMKTVRLIDLPKAWRRRNWVGNKNQGSCVHASLAHLLHWQGQHELAEWWRANNANGETAEGLAQKLEAAKVQFAEVRNGDVSFLDWAIRTRRGANVVVQDGAHMVTLAGLDKATAWILDSNHPDRLQEMPRAEFLSEWKKSGGWAVTVVGPPPPPSPWLNGGL